MYSRILSLSSTNDSMVIFQEKLSGQLNILEKTYNEYLGKKIYVLATCLGLLQIIYHRLNKVVQLLSLDTLRPVMHL